MTHRKGLKHILDTSSLNKRKVHLPLLRGSYLNDIDADYDDPLSSTLEGQEFHDYLESLVYMSVKLKCFPDSGIR